MRIFEFERRVFRHLHWGVFGCLLALAAIGIISIHQSEMPGEPHASKQLKWLVVSVFAFLMTVSLRPAWLRAMAPVAYVVGLLSLLFLPVFGVVVNGSNSWYRFGSTLLQPSEFMKLALCLLLSVLATSRPGAWREPRSLAFALVLALIPIALIFKQPDFGTAAVFVPMIGVMLWMGGVKMRHFAVLGLIGLLGAVVIAANLQPYQRARIASLFSGEEDPQGRDWQINQAVLTLGSGQMWGELFQDPEVHSEADARALGFQWNRAQLKYLGEAHTDFIFASHVGEFGFVGGVITLSLYALFAIFCVSIALSARTLQGGLLVMGLMTIVLTHVALNVGMCLRLVPVTGLPLPFLSYGGSNMLMNFLLGGLICNVAARRSEYDLTKI